MPEPTWHKPRCPNCGSEEIKEWGKTSMSYNVEAISSTGEIENDDMGGDPLYEDYNFDELRCRDCDHVETDPTKFIPPADVVLGEN